MLCSMRCVWSHVRRSGYGSEDIRSRAVIDAVAETKFDFADPRCQRSDPLSIRAVSNRQEMIWGQLTSER